MKLLRLTRHPASEIQQAAIGKIWGAAIEIQQAAIGKIWGAAIEIHQISETLPESPKKAVEYFDKLTVGFDVVEVVLSINLLQAVLNLSEFSKQGGQIVRAVMIRKELDDGSIFFNFSHYEEIKEINVVTKRL